MTPNKAQAPATQASDFTYCPPSYQTDPKAVKRVMAVWMEGAREGEPRDKVTPHCYVLPHLDPRTVALPSPDYYPLVHLSEHSNVLDNIAHLALSLECGAVWILETAAALAVCPREALALISAADAASATGDVDYPWLAHELSAGKHASELAGVVIQRRRLDTGKGQGIPMAIYFAWVGEVWPKLPVVPVFREVMREAPHPTPSLRHVAARMWLEGVILAAYALDNQLRFSPSYTGITTLRRDIAAKEARRHAPLPHLSPERAAEVTAHKPSYLQWRSRFADHDLSGSWVYTPRDNAEMTSAVYIPLHVYDRNWSFVTAAREVPIGEPLAVSEFVPSDPGYYHLLGATPPLDWDANTPGPFYVRPESPTESGWPSHAVYDLWAWEAQIRQARARGWHVEVEYGFHWPTRVDLRPWQQGLWSARRLARANTLVAPGAAKLADGIIKRVGVSAIGRLGQTSGHAVMRTTRARATGADILSRHVDAQGELTGYADVATAAGRNDLARLEMWSTIISNANERTLAAIYQYAPHDTILAYVDGIYTLEPHTELNGSPDVIGGWRYKGLVYVPVDALDRLDTLSPYALVVALGHYTAHGPRVADSLPEQHNETAAALEAEGLTDNGE